MKEMTRILNIAHRGGAGLWPENTLAAFERAFALGCDGVELDCHLSKDGEIVVFHDEALKPELVRDARGQWLEAETPLIKDLTYEELRQFDVGRVRQGTEYAAKRAGQEAIDGERIPLLREAIELAKRASSSAVLWIELKSDMAHPERSADPQALADAVVALLRREDFIERATIVSFNWAALMRVKTSEPRLPALAITLPEAERKKRGFPDITFDELIGAIEIAGLDGWLAHYSDLDETRAAAARKRLKLACWTVNGEADMAHMAALGLHAICTDYPDRLKAVLARG